ncbi:MAG: hypothetical protein KGJ43_03720 [Acidobacteriota bacterium]|nr:hypothetical protein [Acidobacteriota bacterium]
MRGERRTPMVTGGVHRAASRRRTAMLGPGCALVLLLSGLFALAGPSAADGYTFTPVAGSPFTGLGAYLAPQQTLFSPNGRYLADTSFNEVYVQTVSKSGVVGTPGLYESPRAPCKGIPIPIGYVDSVAYSPNGALLAAVEEPRVEERARRKPAGALHIYRVRGRRLVERSCRALPYTGKNPTPERYYGVAFGPDGLLAVTNVGENTATLYSVSSAGKAHQIIVFKTGKDPDAVAFGPTRAGGQGLAVANWGDGTVSIFTISSGVVAPAAGSPVPTVGGPTSVAFSPNAVLAVAGSAANLLYVYAVSFVGALSGVGAAHTDGPPLSVAFSADGGLLGTADTSDVAVFSVAASGLLAPVSGSPFSPPGGSASIAFDGHASLLAVAAGLTATGEVAVYSYAPS